MEINEVVAKNLIAYRKQKGLTQAELAESINYSDKSISKWERGECIPDLAILKQLADLYGITVNDFLNESGELKQTKQKNKFSLKKQIMIPVLSVGLVWLVAIVAFTALLIFCPTFPSWLCFIFALPISSIVVIVFASIWKQKLTNFIATTVLMWTTTLCVFLSIPYVDNLWAIFLVPTVLEVLLILWFFLKADIKEKIFKFGTKNKKQKRDELKKSEEKQEKIENKENEKAQ